MLGSRESGPLPPPNLSFSPLRTSPKTLMANSSRSSKRRSPASTPPTSRVTRSANREQQPKLDSLDLVEVKPEDMHTPKTVKANGQERPSKKPKVVDRKEINGAIKEAVPMDGILDEEEDEEEEEEQVVEKKAVKKAFAPQRKKGAVKAVCRFVGEVIPRSESVGKWPNRYLKRAGKGSTSPSVDDDDDFLPAKNHYKKAYVDGLILELDDDVYVKGEDTKKNYIGRIVEFFDSPDHNLYFTAQWFYRVEDTVIGQCSGDFDPRRVFYSLEKNTNVLDCIVSKITIVKVDVGGEKPRPPYDFYYDMMYSPLYTSFVCLDSACKREGSASSSSTITSEVLDDANGNSSSPCATLLDLYSGCGAMSTGLCTGARLGGLKLETTWAIDLNSHACSSLKLNHPDTQVRNVNAEHYLILLKEWEKLCKKYVYANTNDGDGNAMADSSNDEPSKSDDVSDEEFEVERFLDICYGDPTGCGTVGLKLQVRWKGYDSDEDTWEPMENFGECQERLCEFVQRGHKENIIPCPGDVDVICGGPPCQGISGFNRFRDKDNPLQDVKNRQIIVYMDIVEHLKPKYVLMENVVDLLKFSRGYLGRYAVSRLLKMNYQSRLGIMAAGCYGLPQFRGRAFLWGALPNEKLPQFPLPTHDVVVRGVIPTEFERNLVAFDENEPRDLKEKLLLADAISDLPPVENDEERDEIPYRKPPATEFQRYIRLSKSAMMGESKKVFQEKLFDHRPLKLNEDDYQRVQKIPMRKGANFRDLPGLRVRPDNVVELDPTCKRIYLPSNKPLVPDYAISFIKGKSLKPFGRLWWDEIVPTVVTRAEPHNQVILHPEQARVLTIRENARIQGFPDHYQLRGPIKERYIQVGNAVAVPVSRALGYSLGKVFQGFETDGPLMALPPDYAYSSTPV